MARKSSRGVIKDYQKHRKDIDERIRQKAQEKEKEAVKKV